MFRLDARGLSVVIGDARLVRGVSLSFQSGELVALLGPSGSGKSTLLRALNGFRPGRGRVQLFGEDLYARFDALKSRLGYVPQDDVLHRSLTVEKVLHYSALLRLPGLLEAERRARVTTVLAEVGLADRRGIRVRSLSGGQRKRVSVAMELLGRPSVLFLDEPTSGLDPGLERQLMTLLRTITNAERLTLVTTHVVTSLDLVDLAVFVSQGFVVYVGPASEATDFFEVPSLGHVYELIARDGERWSRRFESSSWFRTYVVDRLTSPCDASSGGSEAKSKVTESETESEPGLASKSTSGPRPETASRPKSEADLASTSKPNPDSQLPQADSSDASAGRRSSAARPLSPEEELARLKAELRARRS